VYDSVTMTKKTHTVADMKDICKALSLNTGGNKVWCTRGWVKNL
jgi:hydroxyethylthiazole kinase-like sugar kinase family protein